MLRKSTRAFRRINRKYFNRFLSAAKLRRREDVEEAIRKQYRSFLHRDANPAELRMWIACIFEEGEGLPRVLKTIARSSEAKAAVSYQHWVLLYDTICDEDRRQIREHMQTLRYRPLISIVMPTCNTPEVLLREAITSIRDQLYENWELCIADDASSSVIAILQELSILDPRIKWLSRDVNGQISQSSNSALGLATGEFVALMNHDDVLPAHALYEMVVELNHHPEADILYSDEDQIDDKGVRHSPHFKSDWNPELFLGYNFINRLGVYRRPLLLKVGGFRESFEGSHDYDLALRAVNASANVRIRHIPEILYHWRSSTTENSFSQVQLSKCIDAARRAKADFLAARYETAEVVENPLIQIYDRIRRPVPSPPPLVSLIVPTRNRHDLLGPCIEGLLHRTTYPSVEIIVIDHQSDDWETRALLARLRTETRVRIMPFEGPFNYSKMNNQAVDQASGDIIGFINNDIDVIAPEWLSEMVSLAVLPANGAIGAKLLYTNDCVQHGGIVLGLCGLAGHAFRNFERNSIGYCARLALTANVSAVTGACMVLRKSVFRLVGGFNTRDLPVAFNDVDLCLKLQAAGYRNVWTPFALLYHHESPSRGRDTSPEKLQRSEREVDYMRRVWGNCLLEDPCYNVNLSLTNEGFQLAAPPRRVKPWTTCSPPTCSCGRRAV